MLDARQLADRYYLEMRWRCLSLAADLDRIDRAPGGTQLLAADPRFAKLRDAVAALASPGAGRAERVQMIFSDLTPPPTR